MTGRSHRVATTTPTSIAHFMTASPYTIGKDQTLAKAQAAMRELGVRHLPVLDAGVVVGLLSQRDIYFVEALEVSGAQGAAVEEAMSQSLYCVQIHEELGDVAAHMAEHKYGCALIFDGTKLVGIFTTTDALRALTSVARGTARSAA